LLRFELRRDRWHLRNLLTRLRHFGAKITKPAFEPDLLAQYTELTLCELQFTLNNRDLAIAVFLPQHDCPAFIVPHHVKRVLADIDTDYGDGRIEVM
jgi:hypothetical protein